MSPMSSSEGVRVVIHPPDTQPYPHTEGFDVPPGYSATFGVKVSDDCVIRLNKKSPIITLCLFVFIVILQSFDQFCEKNH